jgi:hypothetical protein
MRSLEEIDLDVVFEGADRAYISVTRPNRGAPFPIFLENAVSLVDQPA